MACTGHTNSCPAHAGYKPAVTPTTWTNDPLTTSIPLKTTHHNELRSAIAAEITRWSSSWTDPGAVTTTTTVSYLHIRRLRNGINACLAWSWPSHLDNENTDNVDDTFEAQQYNALRDRVNYMEGLCACDCNYACTCDCNYCTCNCNYCTCQCNYACTCNCNYTAPTCGK